MKPVRIVQFGIGPIGAAIARLVADRPGLVLVGGVDIDPSKVGKDLGDVAGIGRQIGVPVTATLRGALMRQQADLVLHSTQSFFSAFKPQILEILDNELDVISTAEELSFPWEKHSGEAKEIDAAAKLKGKRVLGTGVNPGFLLDTLPLTVTAICRRVDSMRLERRVDASKRRRPFQAKIGCGLSVEEFRLRMSEGGIGHVGLEESAGMILDCLKMRPDRSESTIEPVIASTQLRTSFFNIEPGQVAGLQQVLKVYIGSKEFLRLSFQAAVGLASEKDTIRIEGDPDLDLELAGANGDAGTPGIVVNAIPRVLRSTPGLLTMKDLQVVSAWSGMPEGS